VQPPAEQADAPAAETLPAPHAVQLLASIMAEYWPDAHGVQVEVPY